MADFADFARNGHRAVPQLRRRRLKSLKLLLVALFPAVAGAADCIGEPAVLRRTIVGGQAVPLTLEADSWESHHITTNIARILLEEQLGYDVEIVDSRSPRFSIPRIGGCGPKQGVESCCDQTIEPATCAGTSNRKRADLPDAFANLELWYSSKLVLIDRWVTKYQVVQDLGPTGYIGRSGVYLGREYVASGWEKEGEILDHWHAFQRASTIGDLETPHANETINTLAKPHCDEDEVDGNVNWFHEGCQDGWFDPPPCDPAAGGDPSYCGTLYAAFPEYDSGALPQMVTNLGLNLSIAFVGPHLHSLVRERNDAGTPVLYYYWRPSAFASDVRGKRVSFPEEEAEAGGSCSHATIKSNFGTVSCDFPPVQVSKFVWRGLAAAAPDAYALLSALRIQLSDMDTLLASHQNAGGGANATELACRWTWESWVADPPVCDVSYMRMTVHPCDGDRRVTFAWAQGHPQHPGKSAECAGGEQLLSAQRISCDHPELSTPGGAVMFALSLCVTLVCASTIVLLCVVPNTLPKHRWPGILRRARLKTHWRGAMTLYTSGFLLLSCIGIFAFDATDATCVFLHAALLFGTDALLGGLLWSMAHERIVLASRLRRHFHQRQGLEQRAKEEIQRYRDYGSQESAIAAAPAADQHAGSRGDSQKFDASSAPGAAGQGGSATPPQPALAESGEAHFTVANTASTRGSSLASQASSGPPRHGASEQVQVRFRSQLDQPHSAESTPYPAAGAGSDVSEPGRPRKAASGSGQPGGSGGSSSSHAEKNAEALEAAELLGILGVTDVGEFSTLLHARTSARTAVRASILFGVLDPASSLFSLLFAPALLHVGEEEYSFGDVPVRFCDSEYQVAVLAPVLGVKILALATVAVSAFRLRYTKRGSVIVQTAGSMAAAGLLALVLIPRLPEWDSLAGQHRTASAFVVCTFLVCWPLFMRPLLQHTALWRWLTQQAREEAHLAESSSASTLSRGEVPASLWLEARDLKTEGRLGVGAYGDVFLASYHGMPVAVKHLRHGVTRRAMSLFARELRVMASLRHPNVVLLVGFSAAPPLLVMEYLANGSLYDLLHHRSLSLAPDLLLRLLRDAARGVAHLHSSSPPLSHGDLKSPNLLVDENWRCKVADFGMTALRDAQEQAREEAQGRKRRRTSATTVNRSSASVRLQGVHAISSAVGTGSGTSGSSSPSGSTFSLPPDGRLSVPQYLTGAPSSPRGTPGQPDRRVLGPMTRTATGRTASFQPNRATIGSPASFATQGRSPSSGLGVGSPLWAAPEVLCGRASTAASDVYSFGVVLLEALTGQPPYADVPAEAIPLLSTQGRGPHYFVLGADGTNIPLQEARDGPLISHDRQGLLRDLTLRCLHLEPSARPDAQDVVTGLSDAGRAMFGDADWALSVHLPERGQRESKVSEGDEEGASGGGGSDAAADAAPSPDGKASPAGGKASTGATGVGAQGEGASDGGDEGASRLRSSGADSLTRTRRTALQRSYSSVQVQESDIVMGPEIGRGSYATVYEAKYLGTHVAAKKLRVRSLPAKQREAFFRECSIMTRLRHPNLVLLMGIVAEGETMLMVTELMERGSLYDCYHDEQMPAAPLAHVRRVLSATMDMARGMAYLHGRRPPVLHRDLKSPNVLVDEQWRCKVGDFGLSRVRDAGKTMTKVGSPLWVAPEVLRGDRFDERCDQFSFAVIVVELLMWKEPYQGMASMDVMRQVAFSNLRPSIPATCPRSLAVVLRFCFASDFTRRPSFSDIIRILSHTEHYLKEATTIEGFVGRDNAFAESLVA